MGYLYEQRKEKALRERYNNMGDDYIPTTLQDWALLQKYNPKECDRAMDRKFARDRQRAAVKNTGKGITNGMEWRVCEHEKLPKPSAAEQIIIDELLQYNVKWFREVEFMALRNNTGGHPRYDIYIPSIPIVIEYDSVQHHSTPEQIQNDKLKTMFCIEHHIRIERWSREHYYHIAKHVGLLMSEYGIKKKPR